ncbi:MAG: glycoside hydrolase [Bacteroidales bacterium]|nr:glycoside hydrolase [Bacteroidales bacterium]
MTCRLRSITLLALLLPLLFGCCRRALTIPLEDGEAVWGGHIKDGSLMPFAPGFETSLEYNLSNQVNPLLLTSGGKYVWSESPFSFRIEAGEIVITSHHSDIVWEKAGETLSDAFKTASSKFFPADGKLPPKEFFEMPQYNTWIELMYNQNQAGVLAYAKGILDNGLPPGIIMIDDTWQEDYGKWVFHPGRFPNPKAMCDQLHTMGFKLMLWICPFVSMDQYQICREIMDGKGFLLTGAQTWEEANDPYPVRWWNGTSAVLDFSNPAAVEWFDRQLKRLTDDYGVDGFKFDAGDFDFYPADALAKGGNVPAWEQCSMFVDHATNYPYNELRAGWRNAGRPVVNRLHDKGHSWEDLRKLIPEMMAESLMGFSFCCPDMVGGGSFETFLSGQTDPELIVRSAQVHALMPMMQFSLAPWRVLDKAHYAAVLKAVEIRQARLPLIESLFERAAKTGEPIVAPLEYVFPGEGLARVVDEFMLGDRVLVAPMQESGTSRTVILPAGQWKADDGQVYEGGQHVIDVPLDRLPVFERL